MRHFYRGNIPAYTPIAGPRVARLNTAPGPSTRPYSRVAGLSTSDLSIAVQLCFDDPTPPVKRNGKAVFQPTRLKSRFIDDSAIESDGEGGDISSTATTPDPTAERSEAKVLGVVCHTIHKKPPTLFKAPSIRSIPYPAALVSNYIPTPERPVPVERFLVTPPPQKAPAPTPVNCDLCGFQLQSILQLKSHRNTNRCKRRVAFRNQRKITPCKACNKPFKNIHDREHHFKAKQSK